MKEHGETIHWLAAAIIMDDAGKVLLTRHLPKGKWHFPDGEVRFGETIREALIRSFRDDLHSDLVIESSEPSVVTETIDAEKGKHYVTLHFEAEVAEYLVSANRPLGTPGKLDAAWFDRFSLKEGDALFTTQVALARHLGWNF